jgi:predicted signal transduction protein with EAL and GGDEF domain
VALADEFLESTAEDYSLQGHRVRLSASMGVALADDAGDDPYELLRRADVAMYQAKRERSGVSVFAATVTSRDVSHPHLPATSNARHGAPVTSNARNGASAS